MTYVSEWKGRINMKKIELKKNKKKILKIGIPVVLGVGIIVGIVAVNTGSSNMGNPVYSAVVERGPISSELSTSGNVVSDEVKTLFAPANVKIEAISVEKGDVVKAGDVLICFDKDAVDYAQKQSELESAISSANYNASVKDYNSQKAKLSQANSDIANYEMQIANYEEYIKQLTDGISDQTTKKKKDLYAKMESAQKSLNEYELAMQTPDENTNMPELMRKSTEKKNELTKLQDELSLLSDYKTADDWEGKLKDAQKTLEDLKTKLAEAKSNKTSADSSLVNDSKLSEMQLSQEKSTLVSNDSKKKYEQALNGVVADFDGVVTEVIATEGETTQEGSKLAIIERNDKVNVMFKASKFDLASLEVGQSVAIDIVGNKYQGKVVKINHMAEAGNNSGVPMVGVKVEVENPDDNIILGVEAKLKITTASKEDALLVPVEAINEDVEGNFCFLIDENNMLVKKYVTTGVYSDSYAEIVEGLNEGDVIATMSYVDMALEDGMNVTIMQ